MEKNNDMKQVYEDAIKEKLKLQDEGLDPNYDPVTESVVHMAAIIQLLINYKKKHIAGYYAVLVSVERILGVLWRCLLDLSTGRGKLQFLLDMIKERGL